jgi:ORF6N domain
VTSPKALVPTEEITRAILVLRGQRVILDAELAILYGVTTKRLNEQVKRNAKRFPEDFMFQLITEEAAGLRSQIATSKTVGRGGRRYQPYAFTEHGAIQVANVLKKHRDPRGSAE